MPQTFDRDKLTASLVLHEGEVKIDGRHVAYRDSKNILTIGHGRNIQTKGLTDAEADYLFANDVSEAIMLTHRYLPWVQDDCDVRQRVMYELVFQLGIGGVLGFRLMLGYWKTLHYELAAHELLNSKFAREDAPARAHQLAMMLASGADPL